MKKVFSLLILVIFLLSGCADNADKPADFIDGIDGYIIPNYKEFSSPEKADELLGTLVAFEGALSRYVKGGYVVSTKKGDWLVIVGESLAIGASDQSAIEAGFVEGASVYVYGTYNGISSKQQDLPTCTIFPSGAQDRQNRLVYKNDMRTIEWTDYFVPDSFVSSVTVDFGIDDYGGQYHFYYYPKTYESLSAYNAHVYIPNGHTVEQGVEVMLSYLDFVPERYQGEAKMIVVDFYGASSVSRIASVVFVDRNGVLVTMFDQNQGFSIASPDYEPYFS